MPYQVNGTTFPNRPLYRPALEVIRLYADNHRDLSFDELVARFRGHPGEPGRFRDLVHREGDSDVQADRERFSEPFPMHDGTQVVISGPQRWGQPEMDDFIAFSDRLAEAEGDPRYRIVEI